MPVGMTLRELPDGRYRPSCACDWRGAVQTKGRAIHEAVAHARDDKWCFFHRNRTPVGVQPDMQKAV